jgi:hypothetical protein
MNRLAQRLRYFHSIGDVLLFGQILLLWLLLPLLLRLPLLWLLSLLTPRQSKTQGDIPRVRPQQVRLFTDYWLTRPWLQRGQTCMTRTLLRYYFLRRAGVPVRIQIAVKREHGQSEHGQLVGHSWLESPDPHFDEHGSANEFTIIYTYPPV